MVVVVVVIKLSFPVSICGGSGQSMDWLQHSAVSD